MTDSILRLVFFDQWMVVLLVSALLIALAEAGFRSGRALRRRMPEGAEGHSGGVRGAMLGLLGLLIGFSFAMAVARHDTRRTLVVQEANSIGTTWLRAGLLAEPARTEVRGLLKGYTELKLESFRARSDKGAIALLDAKSGAIHRALWSLAESAAAVAPTPLVASFIASLNETIDLSATRQAAMANHVPGPLWLLILIVAGAGSWASGYGSGTSEIRSAFNQIVFPLLIALLISLIADIDRPRKGLIGIDPRPFVDLYETMKP